MRMSRIISVSHARFAGEIAGACIVRVGFGGIPALPGGARRARVPEAVEGVVIKGLRLRIDGIRDGGDVAHSVIVVGVVLQASRRKNFQPSALLVPGVIGVGGVECVRAADQLDHAHGRIIGDGLRVRVRADHARGKHVGIICEVDDLAIGVFHGDRQVSGIVGELGDEYFCDARGGGAR